MSNQIQLLNGGDDVASGQIFFVSVNFASVPFANPSTEQILAARSNDSETVLDIIDTRSDHNLASDIYTLKCIIRNVVDSLTIDEVNQYIMNILTYMSENIVRVFGIRITQAYFTTDNNFPDSSTTLYSMGGSSTDSLDPTTSDLTKQLEDFANKVKAALPSTTSVIIILIIVVVLIIFVYFKRG